MSRRISPSAIGLIEDRNGIKVRVHVRPRARENAIFGIEEKGVRIHIKSPPVAGAANRELKGFLARALSISPSRVEIVSGQRSRFKTVKIRELTAEEFISLLQKTGQGFPAGGTRQSPREHGSEGTKGCQLEIQKNFRKSKGCKKQP